MNSCDSFSRSNCISATVFKYRLLMVNKKIKKSNLVCSQGSQSAYADTNNLAVVCHDLQHKKKTAWKVEKSLITSNPNISYVSCVQVVRDLDVIKSSSVFLFDVKSVARSNLHMYLWQDPLPIRCKTTQSIDLILDWLGLVRILGHFVLSWLHSFWSFVLYVLITSICS